MIEAKHEEVLRIAESQPRQSWATGAFRTPDKKFCRLGWVMEHLDFPWRLYGLASNSEKVEILRSWYLGTFGMPWEAFFDVTAANDVEGDGFTGSLEKLRTLLNESCRVSRVR